MRLFLTEDPAEADRMAEQMRELNESRKAATTDGFDWAVGYLEEAGFAEDHVIVLCIPDLHESLAGIVAGKLKERYYRPTIVFTASEEDPQLLKGSGRSIPDYDMFEALSRVKGDQMYIKAVLAPQDQGNFGLTCKAQGRRNATTFTYYTEKGTMDGFTRNRAKDAKATVVEGEVPHMH
jgi:hypothetical protein